MRRGILNSPIGSMLMPQLLIKRTMVQRYKKRQKIIKIIEAMIVSLCQGLVTHLKLTINQYRSWFYFIPSPTLFRNFIEKLKKIIC